MNQEEFIKQANEYHEYKYDYSKTIYITKQSDVTIICPTHGDFNKRAGIHLGTRGKSQAECRYCQGHIKMSNITDQNFLQKWYIYEPETGLFMNRATKRIIGVKTNRYLVLTVNSKAQLLHRMIFLYMTGRIPDVVDHIDMDKTNNRWNNLRASTMSLNTLNNSFENIILTDAFTYKVKLMFKGKLHQKTFKTLIDAEKYRDKLKRRVEYKANIFHDKWMAQDIV